MLSNRRPISSRCCATGRSARAELFAEYEARIRRFNGKLNAIIWQDPNAAANARNADVATPLAGLPMTLKESNHMKGSPTTWGIPALRNQISQEDAVVVARLA